MPYMYSTDPFTAEYKSKARICSKSLLVGDTYVCILNDVMNDLIIKMYL